MNAAVATSEELGRMCAGVEEPLRQFYVNEVTWQSGIERNVVVNVDNAWLRLLDRQSIATCGATTSLSLLPP